MSTNGSQRPIANLSDQALQLRALLNEKRSMPAYASHSRDHRPTTTTTATVPPTVVQPITGIVSPRQTPTPNNPSPRGGTFFGDGECEHDEDVVKPPSDRGACLAPNLGSASSAGGALSNIPMPRWSGTKPSVRKLKASSNDRKKQKAGVKQEIQEQFDHHRIEEGALTIEDVPVTSDQLNRSRRNSDEYKEISIKAQVLRAFLSPKKSKNDPMKREWIEEPIVAEADISNLESGLPDGFLLQEPTDVQSLAQELLTTQKDLEDIRNEKVRLESENEILVQERNQLKIDIDVRDERETDSVKGTEKLKHELSEITSELKTKQVRIDQLEKDVLTNQKDLLSQEKLIRDLQEASVNEKKDLENKLNEFQESSQTEKSVLQEKTQDLENQLRLMQVAKDEKNLIMEQKLAENERKLKELYTNLHNEKNAREKCEEELKALGLDFETELTKCESLEAEKETLIKQVEDQGLVHRNELQDQKESLLQDLKIQEGIAEIFQRENERLIKELHGSEMTSKIELEKFKEKLKKLEKDKIDQLEQISKLQEQMQLKDDNVETTKDELNKIIKELKKDLTEKKIQIKKLEDLLSESQKKVAESLSLVQIHSLLQNNLEGSFQDMLDKFQDSIRGKIGESISVQLLDSLSKEHELMRKQAEKGQGRENGRDERATTSSNQEIMALNQQYQIQLHNCATVLKLIRQTVLQW